MRRQFTFLGIVFVVFTACNNSDSSQKKNSQTDTVAHLASNKKANRSSVQKEDFFYGQSPVHNGLSKAFAFQSTITRAEIQNHFDTCVVTVTIKSKTSRKTIYAVHFTTGFLVNDSSFMNDNVRSYITGENKNTEVVDNDFGDIVVADFNFDNREDFAIKREEGGNGGPLYNYYLQTADTSFVLDRFLSDTMVFFPTYINRNKKTLTTFVHANAYGENETTYKLDPILNKWKEVRQKFVSAR